MFNPDTKEFILTNELKDAIERLRSFFPYRIIWLCNDQPDNKVSVYAATSKRPINRAIREGFVAAIAQ